MGNSSSRRSKGPETTDPTTPTGLYESCAWDQRIVTRMIAEKKIAPRYKGSGVESPDTEECPICFLNYKAVNSASCCRNYICTECYLQVKVPRGISTCPFCSSSSFGVTYTPKASTSTPGPGTKSSSSTPQRPAAQPSASSTPVSIPHASSPPITPAPPSSPASSPPVMSAESRRLLEEEMRNQRWDRISSDSYVTPRSDRTAWSGGRRSASGRSRNGEESRNSSGRYGSRGRGRAGQHTLESVRWPDGVTDGGSNLLDLGQIEEMMLMEAIRLSMSETERSPTQEDSKMSSTDDVGLADGDIDLELADEETLLQYALSLSTAEQGPGNSTTSEVDLSGSTGIDTEGTLTTQSVARLDLDVSVDQASLVMHAADSVEEDSKGIPLSTSAQRLMSMIDEALSTPPGSAGKPPAASSASSVDEDSSSNLKSPEQHNEGDSYKETAVDEENDSSTFQLKPSADATYSSSTNGSGPHSDTDGNQHTGAIVNTLDMDDNTHS
mmetsp:Transcript_21446/g.31081  ORF Transcript_21446/g.31081 Transcript_21446/m.31081 type:complete len:497 (+) Transcript_21446:130-1620(+)|eukprot:CAMPEP_0185027268 /NCGR_PEP_ID=MMETSP1103-20130426/12091_1 /TAXON_ID=36769 /ORGANISM="Paraphysomonas bandaiensis, Strain Caron Lab Isolate" /LENGTH=496 /DNA_ID=CAMNT_0027561171 /DNA_START=38 /DNA_END=1528 /DNA_ORIENTATION=-